MSAKAVSEASGKAILNRALSTAQKCRFAEIKEDTDFQKLAIEHPWLKTEVSVFFSGFLSSHRNYYLICLFPTSDHRLCLVVNSEPASIVESIHIFIGV